MKFDRSLKKSQFLLVDQMRARLNRWQKESPERCDTQGFQLWFGSLLFHGSSNNDLPNFSRSQDCV